MRISSLSAKQKLTMNWWSDTHYKDHDAIICDGAVRSGKTLSMSLGFVLWASYSFNGGSFAICGKTVTSLRRNVITPLLPILRSYGFICIEKVSRSYIDLTFLGNTNRFYLFGGKDEGSASLIQGMTLSGVFLDEAALMPRSFVEQALARCSVSGSKMWFNCNPDNPAHWFYNEWIKKAKEKHALYVHFTMDDSSILLRIYECIGQNFDRAGNVRYAVTYKPSGDQGDMVYTRERAKQIAREWADGMNSAKYGQVKDFVAVGDVDIKVIGADNQLFDTNVPVRQLLEQLVAKLSIPPFLLGLSWSSTERMSAQQADILTSELEYYRRLLTPVICEIGNSYLCSVGSEAVCRVEWDNINLQDESALADARLKNAQALEIELRNQRSITE